LTLCTWRAMARMRSYSVLAFAVSSLAFAMMASFGMACGSLNSLTQRETDAQLSKVLNISPFEPGFKSEGGIRLTASLGTRLVNSGLAGSFSIKGRLRNSQV